MTAAERGFLRQALSDMRRVRAAELDLDAGAVLLIDDPSLANEIARQYVVNGLSLRVISDLLGVAKLAVLRVLITNPLVTFSTSDKPSRVMEGLFA